MARKRPKKIPPRTAPGDPKPAKIPRMQHRPDPGDVLNLSWKMSSIDRDGPWGWSSVTKSDLLLIVARLRDLEGKTLAELDRAGSHEIPKNRISAEARKRLALIGQDDIDVLFSLRIGKRPRVWGIRDRNVIRIIWWDRAHTVYPMNIADN